METLSKFASAYIQKMKVLLSSKTIQIYVFKTNFFCYSVLCSNQGFKVFLGQHLRVSSPIWLWSFKNLASSCGYTFFFLNPWCICIWLLLLNSDRDITHLLILIWLKLRLVCGFMSPIAKSSHVYHLLKAQREVLEKKGHIVGTFGILVSMILNWKMTI